MTANKLPPITVRGTVYWCERNKLNKYSNKYQVQLGNLSDKAIEAIDTLFDVAGGRSVFNGHPLQQLWHDIHIARCHVANNPTAFARNLGSVTLGMENKDVFI